MAYNINICVVQFKIWRWAPYKGPKLNLNTQLSKLVTWDAVCAYAQRSCPIFLSPHLRTLAAGKQKQVSRRNDRDSDSFVSDCQ